MENEHERYEFFQLQSELCKSMADPKRLCIIHHLRSGEKSVSELAEAIGLKQSNTSQHLSILRKAGVIVPRRESTTVYYSLANPRIGEACDLVREMIVENVRKQQSLAEIT